MKGGTCTNTGKNTANKLVYHTRNGKSLCRYTYRKMKDACMLLKVVVCTSACTPIS